MTDGRWDLKFLGMQIMIEGLALGAFGTIRARTRREPLLQARSCGASSRTRRGTCTSGWWRCGTSLHRGALRRTDRRDREDWAYEMALLMRNRFLGHEFYEEHYAHLMRRSAWNQAVLDSKMMEFFRTTMFRRIVPNLKRIGLLSERIRPHYEALGLLAFEHGKAAPELTVDELLHPTAA